MRRRDLKEAWTAARRSTLPEDHAAGLTTMIAQVVECRHGSGHPPWLRFSDGVEGVIDLGVELYGEVFEPSRDVELFRQRRVHPELRTVVWPNGADLAPEFLHAAVAAASQRERAGA